MQNDTLWMFVSGSLGFAFFLIANFTDWFLELNILAGIIQIILNVFVFVVWTRAYRNSAGFKKFVAFWGVVVPVIMTAITLYRVLIPAFW